MKYYRLRYITTSGIGMLFRKLYNENDKAEMESTDLFKRNNGILQFEFELETTYDIPTDTWNTIFTDANKENKTFYCVNCSKHTEHTMISRTEQGVCSVCNTKNWAPTGDIN